MHWTKTRQLRILLRTVKKKREITKKLAQRSCRGNNKKKIFTIVKILKWDESYNNKNGIFDCYF